MTKVAKADAPSGVKRDTLCEHRPGTDAGTRRDQQRLAKAEDDKPDDQQRHRHQGRAKGQGLRRAPEEGWNGFDLQKRTAWSCLAVIWQMRRSCSRRADFIWRLPLRSVSASISHKLLVAAIKRVRLDHPAHLATIWKPNLRGLYLCLLSERGWK